MTDAVLEIADAFAAMIPRENRAPNTWYMGQVWFKLDDAASAVVYIDGVRIQSMQEELKEKAMPTEQEQMQEAAQRDEPRPFTTHIGEKDYRKPSRSMNTLAGICVEQRRHDRTLERQVLIRVQFNDFAGTTHTALVDPPCEPPEVVRALQALAGLIERNNPSSVQETSWQERVIAEKEALDAKIVLLEKFLECENVTSRVGAEMFDLMVEQAHHMRMYTAFLRRRLALAGTTSTPPPQAPADAAG